MKVSWTAFALAGFALAPMAVAQGSHPRMDMKAGTELVAWTQDQKPEPAPATQATPPDQKPQTETPSSPARSAQDSTQKQHPAAAQSFTGTIVKSGETYVLKTSDNMTYQLDDQTRAKDYEGKQVQVTGGLDSSNNMIKVQDIRSAS